MKYIIYLMFIFSPSILWSQQTVDSSMVNHQSSKDYEIGGIDVIGNQYTDAKFLIAVSRLQVGEKIRIPGNKINQAIKALHNLALFSDIKIYQSAIKVNIIFLSIEVQERPRLDNYTFTGIKKIEREELTNKVGAELKKGNILTEQNKYNAIQLIKDYFQKKGYLDVVVTSDLELNYQKDTPLYELNFIIKKQKKIKIKNISFSGNKIVSSRVLRKQLQQTQRKSNLFSKSQFTPDHFKSDQANIITYYNSLGHLDATIVSDTIWRTDKNELMIHLDIVEGTKYYLGNVSWNGNSKYTDRQLRRVLDIPKGAVYNPILLHERLFLSPNADDISSLYLDDGYLFSQIIPQEIAIRNDTIDLKITIHEGTQATINKVIIKGNSRTNEEVIRREIRTKPGKKFNRSDIIRSQREIITLGFFDPETMQIETPSDPQNGTVDIVYNVEEKSSEQLEFAASWGGPDNGIVGSVGFTINNFSVKNLLHPSRWNPLPQGEGQRLSFRMQSNGKQYQSLNLSFTEPWLGRKKPTNLTLSTFHNRFTNGESSSQDNFASLQISGLSASLATRLRWPDDYFVSTTSFNLQRIKLNNWDEGIFVADDGQVVSNGIFNNVSITQKISRNSLNHPFFPSRGSDISLSLQFTPPYSIFSKKDRNDLTTEEKYKWIEYHKWRFDAAHYTPVVGKLVLKLGAKMGYLGQYNNDLGTSPFERFLLGGNGINNQAIGYQGIDLIALRGYDPEDLSTNIQNGEVTPTPLFQKITAELRYPISLRPSASIYALAFAEAGNAWQKASDYNPFKMKRSVGFGLRAHLPMIGLIGFDYGIGLDKSANQLQNGGFGKFSIILGFEPD